MDVIADVSSRNKNWFDAEADGYDDNKGTTVGSMKDFEEGKKIKSYLKKHSKILDLGCGTGRHVIPLAELGHSCVGVDISSNMLRQAAKKASNKNLKIQFLECDITESLPFDDNTFDMILCLFHTFELNKNRENIFKEAKRLLKKGGRFYLQVHNVFFPAPRMMKGLVRSFFLKLGGADVQFGDTYNVSGHSNKVQMVHFQHYCNVFEMKRYAKQFKMPLVDYGFQYRFANRFPKLKDFFVMNYVYKK